MDDRPLNFYERLHQKAYDIQFEEGRADPIIRDIDLDKAYRLLLAMRGAIVQCISVFRGTALEAQAQLDGTGSLSLVERQTLEQRVNKYQSIVRILQGIIATEPSLPRAGWKSISTAPQDGTSIRVLGRLRNGEPYRETTRWRAISWEIETTGEHLAPTHWLELEALPEGYGGSNG